jgi:putative transposase
LGNHLNASTSLGIDTERSRSVNGTVRQTETDPNALGESGLWVLNGDIENLSRLVEQGISNSNVERSPRQATL